MAKAYYGSRISENRTKTPEGFLICHNVPIARTGWQDYLANEIGVEGSYDKIVKVFRSEEEVFSEATLASFEGKTITDEHPTDWVVPNNMSLYDKGHAQNVRRGTGENTDLLIADLFVTDPNLITKIEQGLKKEVSCGYDCLYEQDSDKQDKFLQKQIRGNHIAVVQSGRAGSRVAIKDSKEVYKTKQEEGGTKRMSKPITKSFLANLGFKQFIKDAEPEEAMQAAKALSEDEELGTQEKKMEDEGEELAQILAAIQGLSQRIEALEKSDKNVHEEVNGLDALEAELEEEDPTNDADNEEAITIPAEEMDGDELTEPGAGYVEPESERPKNPIGDRKAALDTIKALRPAIDSIKDPKERKKAADSLATLIRNGGSKKKPINDSYSKIQRAANDSAEKAAKEAMATKDSRNNGRDYAKKFNPHYKEK